MWHLSPLGAAGEEEKPRSGESKSPVRYLVSVVQGSVIAISGPEDGAHEAEWVFSLIWETFIQP